MTLIEVVVSLVLLAVASVPVGATLEVGSKVVGGDRAGVVASTVVAAQLQLDAGLAQQVFPPTLASSVSPAPQVGGFTFHVTQQAGWCSVSTTGAVGDFGVGSGTEPMYWVVVAATWAADSTGQSQASTLATPAGFPPPSSTSSCPASIRSGPS